ncbi:MAG: glycosyltransferase family 2 protein [Planctomycetota bacterium]|nr:glycosyltransferase family 2 protein [Planctomycetota bacterium]
MASPASSTLPVTVVIPVRNEELNLPKCLERLSRFARVVIVDSGSTDKTAEIAKAAGADFVEFRWNGAFPKKRNWFLRNHAITTPWVLFLDADEYIPLEFVNELSAILPTTSHVGFWIQYSNYFLGRELRHGSPMLKLALFRVGAGEYERIDEKEWSNLDMEVHEHPVLNGSIGQLSRQIEHNDYKGLRAYIARHNEYSSWESARWLRLQETEEAWAHFTSVQRRKYRSLAHWWTGPMYTVYSLLWKRGALDGIPGIAFGVMKGIYFFQIWLKITEAKLTARSLPRDC